jgi:hypothetical protein
MDLSVFGTRDRGQLNEMEVTISGPLRPVVTTGTADPGQVLTHTARGFGLDHGCDNW